MLPTFTCRRSFANSGDESMCFFRSKSRYSKTRYKRFSLCTTSCNLLPEFAIDNKEMTKD